MRNSNHNYKKIPNCLRKYRKARGLNQKEVAQILGLKSTGMISRWEKGSVIPSLQNVFMLASLYRTMAEALFIDLSRTLREEIINRENAVLQG